MKKKIIMIIDGQGGGIGKQLTQTIKDRFPELFIRAVGTNVMATQAMIKAGADEAATGENAIIVGCKKADLIVGPIGIAIADSLMGEITPAMSVAVGQSNAARILLPMNQCDNQVVGVENASLSYLIRCCLDQIQKWISNQS